ncbi:hypothetical protein NLG97_g8024 [Lecanicillium saksenae]|uniref:Uncharacterized protein n=1 Tax=Lecanicillium saksenae TaxID=468837 RepID=A0ACC1QK55_9HYPO|nr:hypothetical protein NLG97_g8024 [Lecanicillium saksenae]
MGDQDLAIFFDVGKIVGARPRHNMGDLELTSLSLDLFTLIHLLKQLSSRSLVIRLERVYLASGTRAEALDVRRDAPHYYVRLRDPYGAECETISDNDYGLTFGFDSSNWRNKAEEFMSHPEKGLPNPAREHENVLHSAMAPE